VSLHGGATALYIIFAGTTGTGQTVPTRSTSRPRRRSRRGSVDGNAAHKAGRCRPIADWNGIAPSLKLVLILGAGRGRFVKASRPWIRRPRSVRARSVLHRARRRAGVTGASGRVELSIPPAVYRSVTARWPFAVHPIVALSGLPDAMSLSHGPHRRRWIRSSSSVRVRWARRASRHRSRQGSTCDPASAVRACASPRASHFYAASRRSTRLFPPDLLEFFALEHGQVRRLQTNHEHESVGGWPMVRCLHGVTCWPSGDALRRRLRRTCPWRTRLRRSRPREVIRYPVATLCASPANSCAAY